MNLFWLMACASPLRAPTGSPAKPCDSHPHTLTSPNASPKQPFFVECDFHASSSLQRSRAVSLPRRVPKLLCTDVIRI